MTGRRTILDQTTQAPLMAVRARFVDSHEEDEKEDDEGDDVALLEAPDSVKMINPKHGSLKSAGKAHQKKVRLALLSLLIVFTLLVALIIFAQVPRCPPRSADLEWWQKSAFYQIYPKSFKDSNGDGIGDLRGIYENRNYLQGGIDSLNVSAVWLNPIYPHGGVDNGYDVTDYTNISTEFGTLEDFEALTVALHDRNMKLIMDFIPNHTSDKHPWFKKSRKKDPKYQDYYVWRASHNGGPPNNWQTIRGSTSAWTLDSERGEYYLHQYVKEQPDLNIRNPHVQKELEDVLMFWLERGVDGFRVDAIPRLFECGNMTDEPKIDPNGPLNFKNMNHTCTNFQPETYEMVTRWRHLIDVYARKFDTVIFMMVEAYGFPNQISQFYNYDGKPGAHMATNMALVKVDEKCHAQCIYSKINEWISMAKTDKVWSNWQTGNHDQARVASRFNGERTMINNMNMLLLTLPGTSLTYYGEEIGMHNIVFHSNDKRMKYRSPLQWSAQPFAGFTTGNTTWLPLPDDYTVNNIKTQTAQSGRVSNLKVFCQLIRLRKEPSLQRGTLQIGVTDSVLFYVRQAVGFPGYLVAMNFGPDTVSTVDLVSNAPGNATIPNNAEVVLTTANFATDSDRGTSINLTNLTLELGQGMVFKLS